MIDPPYYSVYCDGSSHAVGNKPGGWGFVIVHSHTPLAAGSGGLEATTNNVMEVMAAIKGLEAVKAKWPEGVPGPLELVSDSQYTLGLASGKSQPVKNKEVAEILRALVIELNPRLRWVRGHDGNKWNERCDGIAKMAKMTVVRRLAASALQEQQASDHAIALATLPAD